MARNVQEEKVLSAFWRKKNYKILKCTIFIWSVKCSKLCQKSAHTEQKKTHTHETITTSTNEYREKKWEKYRNCYSEWGKKNPYRLLLMPIGWMANTAKLCALQTFLRFSSFCNFHKNWIAKKKHRVHTLFAFTQIAHLLVCHYL